MTSTLLNLCPQLYELTMKKKSRLMEFVEGPLISFFTSSQFSFILLDIHFQSHSKSGLTCPIEAPLSLMLANYFPPI